MNQTENQDVQKHNYDCFQKQNLYQKIQQLENSYFAENCQPKEENGTKQSKKEEQKKKNQKNMKETLKKEFIFQEIDRLIKFIYGFKTQPRKIFFLSLINILALIFSNSGEELMKDGRGYFWFFTMQGMGTFRDGPFQNRSKIQRTQYIVYMEETKQIKVGKIYLKKGWLQCSNMRMILNKTLKIVQVCMRKNDQEIKFVISKAKVNKQNVKFDYQRKKIVIPFVEMDIFMKEWSRNSNWKQCGKIKNSEIAFYPSSRNEAETDTQL